LARPPQAVCTAGAEGRGRPDGPTSLRCSARGGAAELAAFAGANSAQTTAASQFTKRAARAPLAPALLGPTYDAGRAHRLRRASELF